MMPMVFVPLSHAELRAWAGGSHEPDLAHAATPDLLAAFGLDPADDEEADLAATVLASLECVRRGLPRLVAAVEVRALPQGADAIGGVAPGVLPWRDVRALFVDDPDDLPGEQTLRLALDGDLSALDSHPLLWFGPSEVDQLPPSVTTPARPQSPGA